MYASALDFQGLYSFPNPLSKVPVGACLFADNLVANRDGIAECRRGIAPTGSSMGWGAGSGWIENIFGYQNRLISQGSGSASGSLFYDSTGAQNWTPFTSTYATPTADPYFASAEANKNMYLVGLKQTSPGPGAITLKMAAYNVEPIPAGVPPGLDGTAVLAGAGSGFLGSSFQAAYQIVFGYTDVNGNLNLGNPSERILIVNAGGGSDNVTLTFTVPQGLTTSYFYQIYRTVQTAYSATPSLNVPPGAEPQLAGQFNLTGGQISALSVTVTDVTPDVLLGAALYTNPSQEGSSQTNDRPPFAIDACLFGQMMFYSNTVSLPILDFSLISVGAPNGIQLNDTIVVNGITFTAKAAQANGSQQFAFVTTGTVAQNIDSTARNLIQCINANAATTLVYAFYLSGYNQLPGLISLQSVSGSTNFVVTSSRGGAFSPVIPSSGNTFISSTDSLPNGLYVSKIGQPEAVPLDNVVFVGGGDQPILRILPLRDRVIVVKTDGIFVVTGSTPQNLSVSLLDSTIICIARGTAKVLNNSVYLLSQQGVVSITESGVTIQSRAIEADLLALSTISYTNTSFSNLCSAISYESERMYILLVPQASNDLFPKQAYCYNWITNVWTHWPLDMSYGYVNPFDNALYVGRPLGLSFAYMYKERKTYSNYDYLDDQIAVTITGVMPTATGAVISLSGAPSPSWAGLWLEQSMPQTIIISDTSISSISLNTNGSPITVECIGGGGTGGAVGGGGGGGGEYRRSTVPYVSGSSIPIQIGQGTVSLIDVATPTIWNNGVILANGGSNYGGLGGSNGTGNIGNNGGNGGASTNAGGGGGGGAGGPNGAGGNGGLNGGASGGGGGGGGNGGGSAGSPNVAGGNGGNGGNNSLGSGHGTGDTGSGVGAASSGGGGGGGKFLNSGGGVGSNGIEYGTAGSGGGGGGDGGDGIGLFSGGNGGSYGGGGGGGGSMDGGGLGANGVMIITYFTSSMPNLAYIDSVDVLANTITVDLKNSSNPGTQIAWVNGAASIDVSIPLGIQFAPLTGNFPHFLKIWGRMNYWFYGGNFRNITSGCTSDIAGPTFTTISISVNAVNQSQTPNFAWTAQTIVPQGCSLSRYIVPSLSLSVPYARFACLGVTVSYEIESDVSA